MKTLIILAIFIIPLALQILMQWIDGTLDKHDDDDKGSPEAGYFD
jgi:hypothetical protein